MLSAALSSGLAGRYRQERQVLRGFEPVGGVPQPAWSSSTIACAPGTTLRPTSSTCFWQPGATAAGAGGDPRWQGSGGSRPDWRHGSADVARLGARRQRQGPGWAHQPQGAWPQAEAHARSSTRGPIPRWTVSCAGAASTCASSSRSASASISTRRRCAIRQRQSGGPPDRVFVLLGMARARTDMRKAQLLQQPADRYPYQSPGLVAPPG